MPKWTEEQLKAINTKDKTLLVSAAAGSGKTATLTERIISSVLDRDNPKDISKMLIVTFTNAAVRELRDRISAAIMNCAKENPGDMRLEEQLLRVKDARIVTINSFCNDILRSTAESVGLPPNYRIAEPAESGLIAGEILEGMLLSAYEGELSDVATAEEFAEVAEGLVGVKNESELGRVLLGVYDKLSSEILGVGVLFRLINDMTLGASDSPDSLTVIVYIKRKLREMLEAVEREMSGARDTLALEGATEKTLAVFDSDLVNIRAALAAESYRDIRAALISARHETMSNSKVPSYQRAKNIRDGYVAKHKKFTDEYFALDEENLRYLLTKVRKSAEIIYKFLLKFDETFLAEKRARGIVEFRDAERYAYLALVDSDGRITPFAEELSAKYSDIYIDEYQDVNALQAGVFEAISRADNCFMVGDIKQSIYGFRSAKPELFAMKKRSYPELDLAGDSSRASLFMSKNFRCDENIIDFTNGVFDKLFSAFAEGIGYTDSDRLVFAKVYGDGERPVGHIPEIRIVEKAKETRSVSADSDTPEADAMLEEDITAQRLSAEAVARLVASLVGKQRLANGRLIRPSDIAILTRSVKSAEESYTEAIEAVGFECEVADSRSFFLNEEVLLMLSLLNAIDNPGKDIHLAAVMTSPLFDFSFDELLRIRREGGGDTLYASLVAYSELHPEDTRAAAMITTLARYREISEGMSVHKLITLLFEETGMLTLVSEESKIDNLMLLHSHARRYERGSFRGLYGFISYINSVIENDGEFSPASEDEGVDDNKIRFLTYHRSKGLEFPVVIMAETQKRLFITDRGASARVKLASDFGFSVGVREPSGLAVLKNPVSDIIDLYNRDKEFEESLRVLYVALTRARERLYIFGSTSDGQKLVDKANDARENLSKYSIGEMTNMLDILLTCRNMGRIVCNGELIGEENGDFARSENAEIQEDNSKVLMNSDEPSEKPSADEGAARELLLRFNYSYPYLYAKSVPEKLSVSVLSPAVLDGNEEVVTLNMLDGSKGEILSTVATEEDGDDEILLPRFMSDEEPDLSAERGIATHTFMQFCDFESLGRLGAEGELARLRSGEFIPEDLAPLVRTAEIDRFIGTDLFSEILSAKKIYRELRFNMRLSASLFTTDEERKAELGEHTVLVQGVIDCVIERLDGSLHLIDYKTDRMSKAELNSLELASRKLIARHSRQLSYYALAVERVFGRAPTRIGIYSTHLGAEINIP